MLWVAISIATRVAFTSCGLGVLVFLLLPWRAIEAVFGEKWGRLDNRESRFKILYGGIDSKSVTERMDAFDLSGACAEIAGIIAEFEPALPIRVIPQYAPPVRPTSRQIDTTKVLLVSRLHPKKRVDEAIRVMRRVADKKPDSRLVIFGFSYGDKEETDVTRLLKDLDLDKHVVFAGFASDPGEIYDDAAVTLTTSQSEGFSQVLLESFAHGVPVVAYECSYGPRDVIRHDVNGYLHEFGDVEAAADSVVRILIDPALRARLSAAALETVTEFSPERFERNWVRLCTEVASRQPPHVVTDPPAQPAEQSLQPRPRSGIGLVAALRETVRWVRERQRRR